MIPQRNTSSRAKCVNDQQDKRGIVFANDEAAFDEKGDGQPPELTREGTYDSLWDGPLTPLPSWMEDESWQDIKVKTDKHDPYKKPPGSIFDAAFNSRLFDNLPLIPQSDVVVSSSEPMPIVIPPSVWTMGPNGWLRQNHEIRIGKTNRSLVQLPEEEIVKRGREALVRQKERNTELLAIQKRDRECRALKRRLKMKMQRSAIASKKRKERARKLLGGFKPVKKHSSLDTVDNGCALGREDTEIFDSLFHPFDGWLGRLQGQPTEVVIV